MGAKDIAIRLLSEHCLADIATAVLPGHDVVVEEIRRTQLQLIERIADEVALARIDGRPVVLHVEYQADDETHLPQRVLAYHGMLALRFPDRGVVSVVVYLRAQAPKTPFVREIMPGPGAWQLAFRYEVFCPWEHVITPADVRAHPGLAPLALRTPGIAAADLPEIGQIVASSRVPGLPPSDLAAIAYIVGGHRFDAHLLHSYLRSTAMKDSVTYQTIIREGRERGLAEGIEQGIATTILELVEIRLGKATEELIARIAALSLGELETLRSAALRATDDAALAALLAAAGRPSH